MAKKPGLYANIRKRRASGKPPRRVGSKGAPTAQDFKNAAKTAKKRKQICQWSTVKNIVTQRKVWHLQRRPRRSLAKKCPTKRNRMSRVTVKDCLAKLEKHEAECLIRYGSIEKRLEDGSKRFDKLERMLWAIYPFILGAIGLAKYL